MLLVRSLSLGCVSMALGLAFSTAPSHAAGDVPFAPGFYVPADQAQSCKDKNFEAYDWVLKFGSRNGRLTMGSSEGVCSLSISKRLSNNRYSGGLECNSQGELSESTISFRTGAGKKIVEIDGQPYAFCGAGH